MKTVRGAIFDMDGTLLDSMWVWTGIGRQYIKSLGMQPAPDLDDVIIKMSLNDAASYLIEQYRLEKTIDDLRNEVNKLVEKQYFETLELKEGVRELLAHLKETGVKLCVATASDRYVVEAALKRNGVFDDFGAVFTCTELNMSKDTADIYETAMAWLGTDKSNTIVFEDAAHAVQSAKDAGFIVAAIYDDSEKHNQERIRETADYYLDSPAQWQMIFEA